MFKFSINFQFIFTCGVTYESNFILSHVALQFSEHHLYERLPFAHYLFLSLFWKSVDHIYVGLIQSNLFHYFGLYICFYEDFFFCLFLWGCIDFLGGSNGKASVYNVRDLSSIPGLGRFPGEGNGNPLQYSCIENRMDGGAWCRLLSMGLQRVRHD